MFARIACCAVMLWCGCAASLWLLRTREVEEAPAAPKHTMQTVPRHQVRRGVQKDIWTISGKDRLHFRLKSDHSLLAIEQKQGKLEAVETLGNLECCLQESVDKTNGVQNIRYITGPKGTYSFPAHRFVADEVHLSFYQAPGTCLPRGKPETAPFLSGVAEEVVFSEIDHTPHFNAYHLKAEFSPAKVEAR